MSTLRVNNITDTSGGDTNLNVPNTAKAWVNFNGVGTVAIRADFNVNTITDNGTGSYTVNFSNALADTNYSAVGTTFYSTTGAAYQIVIVTAMTTSSVNVANHRIDNQAYDNSVSLAIFR